MIDTHSHILFGIDDGSRSIEESIQILKNYNKIGIKNIILTPHYINGSSYVSSKDNNLIILDMLRKELKNYNIDTNLYLGNEIYIDNEIEELLKQNKISSLNNTEYLLIELPMSGEWENYLDLFLDLINVGYKVVLAHPERYASFQRDFNKIYELSEIGVLFQCNIGSLIGDYGKHSKKTIKRMLKEKMVYMFGTDIHRNKSDYSFLEEAKQKLNKYLDKNEIQDVLINNASKLLR